MDVKWIKITTNIFDDEKIKIIDTMPARDEILVIWFKLLALAGKVNQSGMLFMNNKIAYTPEMLSAVFNRELNVVKLALSIFSNFGMIEIEDNEIICISNWDKHQNIDGLEKIRLQTNERVKKSREKKKTMLTIGCNATCNATVTESNALEEELDLELKLELEQEKEKKKRERKNKEPIIEVDTRTKFEVCIDEFKLFRKSIKKPMSDHAVNLLLKNLNSLANDEDTKIKILEQSIVNGWSSVYAIKDNQSYGKNNTSDTDNIFMKIGREER